MSEFPDNLALFGCLDILIRCKVIRDKIYSVRVEDFIESHRRQVFNRDRTGDIIGQYRVQLCLYKLAGLHMIQSRVGRENLLCHGHSHNSDSSC